tara:strand:- start:3931 stop:5346 length:1416 start_codon:yes stop_codon:yes gene_type:complete
MTAIITDRIKKEFAQLIFDENAGATLGDSNNYFYVAVGRAQQWQPASNLDTVPDPVNTEREERLFRYNLQSVKAVEAFSYVVPLTDWVANAQYAQYNDNVSGQPAVSYYIRNEDNNVYVCIRNGKNAQGAVNVSTVKPSHTDTTLPIEADGYVWKFMYTISTADANKFLTSAFMPVKFVDSADVLSPDFQQYSVQNAAVAGQIIGYRVVEAGGSYSSAPALTIVGNGSGAQARAILNSTGGVEAVEVGDSASAPLILNMGSGYNYANVVVSSANLAGGGINAGVVPIFARTNGIGSNAIDDLRSTAIMFNIKPTGTVEGTWPIDQSYRQIGLWKNPTQYDSSGLFTDPQGVALQRLNITPAGNNDTTDGYVFTFGTDTQITQSSSGAAAWLDWYDDSDTIWYHQDEYTGFVPFVTGSPLRVSGDGANDRNVTALIDPDLDKFTGEIHFINNFAAVGRELLSTQDIKLVIKL